MDDAFSELDRLLKGIKEDDDSPVVMMLDEAQYLLGEGEYKKNIQSEKPIDKKMDAFLFRLVRLWLCKKRRRNIVAVFAGTTTELMTFIIKDDYAAELSQSDSRGASQEGEFHPRGNLTFPPFFTTTTIGCLQTNSCLLEPSAAMKDSDHVAAIPYGRPLFAVMDFSQYQAFLPQAIARMLLSSPADWDGSKPVWLNILGTRAQMGQTNFNFASQLVAGSYANFVGLDPKGDSARITYLPDPVCARLAMRMMDPQCSMECTTIGGDGLTTIRGRPKIRWVGKMKQIYSEQICTPEKGDLGEVMVALYFLFCADEIRGANDRDYNTFSVRLGDWIERLVNGGRVGETVLRGNNANKKARFEKKRDAMAVDDDANTDIAFGAIQVCRNYIRSYNHSWASLRKHGFLESLYKSGVGFYVFAGCSVIDLVFPLRLGKDKYLPLFVSVKSHVYFSPKAAKRECDRMVEAVEASDKSEESNSGEKLGALCILAIFGSGSESQDAEYKLDPSCVQELVKGNVESKVLRIQDNDEFGISKAFLELTTPETEESEAFTSHSFIGLHCNDGDLEESFCDSILRLRPKTRDETRKRDAMNKKVLQLAKDLRQTKISTP